MIDTARFSAAAAAEGFELTARQLPFTRMGWFERQNISVQNGSQA